MKPLRILQLCSKPPVPAIDGGCLAMLRMAEGLLAEGHTVRILAIATDKHPFSEEKIHADFRAKTKYDALHVDTNVRWLPAFLSLFKTSSYNIDRFYSFGFEARLTEILAREEYDIVQLESLYMCPYIRVIRKLSRAKIVLRAHNTESDIWTKNASEETDPFRKLWLRDLAGKLERYERNAFNEVDAIIPITTQDEKRIREMDARVHMHTATFAMTRSTAEPGTGNRGSGTVFHIGAMDWKPNHDGVKWLVEKVWPLVVAKNPEAQLHLAGKGMDIAEFSGIKNVVAHGEVKDAAEFMNQHSILAIPLQSGGGVKVKMIEGMFAGKAIVTTPVGAEGIAGKIGTDFLVAITAEEFASKLLELIGDPQAVFELGSNAQKTALENHDLKRVTEKLSDFYRSIL